LSHLLNILCSKYQKEKFPWVLLKALEKLCGAFQPSIAVTSFILLPYFSNLRV
jgi:hypothetical protein